MLTLIIIALTAIISVLAFNNNLLMDRLIFYPPAVKRGEWYRLFTYGALHADYMHLIFNMFTLYLFGTSVEKVYTSVLGNTVGSVCYLLLYATALFISIFPTYLKQQNNARYYGVGASGAVSAIVFAYILIHPMSLMGILFIPVWLPAFLFGIVFILISMRLDKKQTVGVNHLAHIVGGVYGIIFISATFALMRGINLFSIFIHQIQINSIDDVIHFGY